MLQSLQGLYRHHTAVGKVTQVNIIMLDPGGIVVRDFFIGETMSKPLTKRMGQSLKLLCVPIEDVL